jgi:hypothetical protein
MCVFTIKPNNKAEFNVSEINLIYAKNYSIITDLTILWKNIASNFLFF